MWKTKMMTYMNKYKKYLPLSGIILLFLVGIGLLTYPFISNSYVEHTSGVKIGKYVENVRNIDKKSIEVLENQALEYNNAVALGDSKKLSAMNYNALLSLDDTDVIGYIEIPSRNIYLPICHGLSDDVLERGVGHMPGTSLPFGGESTHCVLAGHTALPSAKLFTDIDKLNLGDIFYIHVLDKDLKYEVNQIKTVLPDDSKDIQVVKGKDYVTLLTCTPYGVNTHRLLVRGERIN